VLTQSESPVPSLSTRAGWSPFWPRATSEPRRGDVVPFRHHPRAAALGLIAKSVTA
jgi:hypothetical protein